jgi:hypothetical protein
MFLNNQYPTRNYQVRSILRIGIIFVYKYSVFFREVVAMENKKFDLLERLIDFAVRIIKVAEALPNTKAGNQIKSQILRSGTSPAPNYSESQSAE